MNACDIDESVHLVGHVPVATDSYVIARTCAEAVCAFQFDLYLVQRDIRQRNPRARVSCS